MSDPSEGITNRKFRVAAAGRRRPGGLGAGGWTRVEDFVAAIALIVNTPLGRKLGNIFLAMSKRTPLTRLFADEGTAVAWLSDFAP